MTDGNTKRAIKKFIFNIESKVPYIPSFTDPIVILQCFILSLLVTVTYTFLKITNINDFFIEFSTHYKFVFFLLLSHLFILIAISGFFKKLSVLSAISIILVINFLSLYVITGIINKDPYNVFFLDYEKNIVIFMRSILTLFFCLIYFDWRQKNIAPANVLAKLSFLQSKMRPHFLFNTINTIVSLIKKEPILAKKMLLNLAELLRASLKEDNITDMTYLKDEISLANKYLDIEKIRLGDKLKIVWDVEPLLDEVRIPKLVIQPLLENCVLHGIQTMSQGGEIKIKISKNLRDRVLIEISNPFKKVPNSKPIIGNNITLKNLEERLKLYYEGDASIKTNKEEEKFYICIDIPLTNNGIFF